MRITFLAAAAVLLAACSGQGVQTAPNAAGPAAGAAEPGLRPQTTAATRVAATVASLPDLGSFVAYDRVRTPIRRGPYTWHPVRLSEEHALRAVVGADLVLAAPDGRPIRLQYVRHVEHPDGNWTWIGRTPGADAGQEAVLTFGADAVFGTVPNGRAPPFRVATRGRQAWLVETDATTLGRVDNAATRPREPDFRLPPRAAGSASVSGATTASATAQVAATATATTTVDLLIGYTTGYASGLGGSSHAVTRVTNLVEITNQAYANSQVNARLRLVGTAQVGYTDASANEKALYELTGVKCSEQAGGGLSCSQVAPPATLQPLHDAREQLGADLVSLVRDFQDPDHDGCGIAWLNGGGQDPISSGDAVTGFSVVSDGQDGSFFCRDETLAHELGHNMGSAHDRDTAEGSDGVLQADEFGRYPYSFGYKPASFYTIMAYGDSGQNAYRVYSNPQITSCGGSPCGVADQADNARSLRSTLPVIATFRESVQGLSGAPTHFSGDFNADGRSDVFWRNLATGENAVWRSANKGTPQGVSPVSNLQWDIVGVGDFNRDGRSDILWRNLATGTNAIWRSANKATPQGINPVTNLQWGVVGVGDFNNDGQSDVLWRNSATGANTIWRSGNQAALQVVQSVTDLNWRVVGVGDFNADGRSDILWRNRATGANAIWKSANKSTLQGISPVTNLEWTVAGVGDFNGDGKDDVLWRNTVTGANSIWNSGNKATPRNVSTVTNLQWKVVGVGDFDADGKADILWRNTATGANTIWKSANQSTLQGMSSVTDLAWVVRP